MDLGCELQVSFVHGHPSANEELDALANQGARWIKMGIGNVVSLSLTNLHPRSRDCVVCFGPIVFSLGVLWFCEFQTNPPSRGFNMDLPYFTFDVDDDFQ